MGLRRRRGLQRGRRHQPAGDELRGGPRGDRLRERAGAPSPSARTETRSSGPRASLAVSLSNLAIAERPIGRWTWEAAAYPTEAVALCREGQLRGGAGVSLARPGGEGAKLREAIIHDD